MCIRPTLKCAIVKLVAKFYNAERVAKRETFGNTFGYMAVGLPALGLLLRAQKFAGTACSTR
jgi:hypothetical protein